MSEMENAIPDDTFEESKTEYTELEVANFNYEILKRRFMTMSNSIIAAFKKLNIEKVEISAAEYDEVVDSETALAIQPMPDSILLFLLTNDQREALEAAAAESKH